MIRTLLKPLSFIPAILLMMMIYHFSAQPAEVSSQLSYKVSYKIVEIADYVFETNLDYWQMDEWAQRINGVTRKLAHMTEYFALAIAVSFPLYVYGVHGIWLMLLAGMICVGFAAGDESVFSGELFWFVLSGGPEGKQFSVQEKRKSKRRGSTPIPQAITIVIIIIVLIRISLHIFQATVIRLR